MLFFSPALIGLDIGPHALRLVQLRKTKSGWLVERMAYQTLTKDIFADDKIKNWEALSTLLKELVLELQLEGGLVALQIPAHLVRMQRIKLAKDMRDPDIEAEIYAQVQRDLLENNETLCIDYKVMINGDQHADVFFAAARQTYLSQYMMCVNGAGLHPKIVDVDIYALMRAITSSLTLSQKKQQIVLYTVDDIATLIVFQEEIIAFYQHFEVSIPHLFLEELKKHLQLCLSTFDQVDKLIICLKKSESTLVKAYVREVCILDYPNPFQYGKLSLAKSIDKAWAIQHAHAFLISLGLAMREVPKW